MRRCGLGRRHSVRIVRCRRAFVRTAFAAGAVTSAATAAAIALGVVGAGGRFAVGLRGGRFRRVRQCRFAQCESRWRVTGFTRLTGFALS